MALPQSPTIYASESTAEYTDSVVSDVVRQLRGELVGKLGTSFHGVVGIEIHIQSGVVNHAKINSGKTIKFASPKIGGG